MTWAKYSTEFSDEIANAGLTDAAYRTHSEAIAWIYRLEDTTLRIPKHLIRRFAGSDYYETAAKELADTGFWRDRGDVWEIIHHADVIRQSIQAQRQKRDRDKRAQQARRNRLAVTGDVSADVNAAVSHRISGDTTNQSNSFPSAPPTNAKKQTKATRT